MGQFMPSLHAKVCGPASGSVKSFWVKIKGAVKKRDTTDIHTSVSYLLLKHLKHGRLQLLQYLLEGHSQVNEKFIRFISLVVSI